VLEQTLGRKAALDLQPMQKGDVAATMADVSALERAVHYRPSTPVEVGIPRFVEWYRSYYKV
jgi:UDP-glucuronate 4-epimerase